MALAAIYALLATAYSLIYGLVGRINLAFGDIAVIGGYGAIGGVGAAVAFGFGEPIGRARDRASAVATALAALLERLVGPSVVAPLHERSPARPADPGRDRRRRGRVQECLRLSQGVARALGAAGRSRRRSALAAGGAFVVTVTPMQIAVAALRLRGRASACCCCSARSRFGRKWRAFADDPVAAALFGVDAAAACSPRRSCSRA